MIDRSAPSQVHNEYGSAFMDYVQSLPEWEGKRKVPYAEFRSMIRNRNKTPAETEFVADLMDLHMRSRQGLEEAITQNRAPRRLAVLHRLIENKETMSAMEQYGKRVKILGDIADNPVYKLLKEIAHSTYNIAEEEYSNVPKEDDSTIEDHDAFLHTKENFAVALVSLMEERGNLHPEDSVEDWIKDVHMTASRYAALEKIALNPNIENRKKFIRNFIREMPSSAGERFYWKIASALAKEAA